MASVVALKVGILKNGGQMEIIDSFSGIYLKGSSSPPTTGPHKYLCTDDVIITSNPKITFSDKNIRVFCALDSGVKQETVEWHALEMMVTRPLEALSSFLKSMTFQYDFVPQADDDSSGSIDLSSVVSTVSLTILKFADSAKSNSILCPNRTHYIKQAQIEQMVNSPLKVESCPFALVNPALFLGYTSHGSVSYIARSKGEDDPLAIFTDLRFLDGMNGSMAYLDPGFGSFVRRKPADKSDTRQVAGMVVGSLRKKNGEGALTIIAPWNTVSKVVAQFCSISVSPVAASYSLLPLLWSKSSAETANSALTPSAFYEFAANSIGNSFSNSSVQDNSNGVIAIVANLIGGTRTWGSGVLLDDETIVTNEHVVRGRAKSITAWFSKEHSVELSLIGSPIKGIDLAYLKTRSKQPWMSLYRPVEISTLNPEPKEHVRSVGYGIFYPHIMGSTFSPLHSEGILSRVFYLPLTDSPSTTNNPLPAMLVSSAGCWNGSSGGGVFSQATGKLVGLMSSNGKEGHTGAVIPEMAFVIPAHLVDLGWALIRKQKQVSASERVQKLWQLRETHISLPKL